MGQAPVVQGKPVDPAPGYVPGPMYAAHAGAYDAGYGGYPRPPVNVVPMGMLPPEEQIIINYRMAVMCFAGLDLMNTSLNVLAAWALNDKFQWWEPFLLLWIMGPLFGFLGAQRLSRPLTAVYVAFCISKMSFQIVCAIFSLWLWTILFAVVQFWITKIVATFWLALGVASPERRAELLEVKEVGVQMVYW